MNFTFRHIEVFWAVMTTGSTTAAAALLHTSQPTISRELSRFEKLTQLTLFQRSSGKLLPTEQGMQLFEEVQRSYFGLERIGNAVDAIRHFSHGHISIASLPAFSTALLPYACARFCQQFPNVRINIQPEESPVLEELLSAQRFHLGLTEGHTAPQGTKIEQLLALDVVCVLPAQHALAQKTVLSPQDFAGQNFIYLAAGDPYRQKLDDLFRQHAVERCMVLETHSAAAVCASANLGIGVAIVNPLTALDFVERGLQIRRFSHAISYCVSAVIPLHRPPSQVTENFLIALRESCEGIRLRLQKILPAS